MVSNVQYLDHLQASIKLTSFSLTVKLLIWRLYSSTLWLACKTQTWIHQTENDKPALQTNNACHLHPCTRTSDLPIFLQEFYMHFSLIAGVIHAAPISPPFTWLMKSVNYKAPNYEIITIFQLATTVSLSDPVACSQRASICSSDISVLTDTVHCVRRTMSDTIRVTNRCHKLQRITKFPTLTKQRISLYGGVNFNRCDVNTWKLHEAFTLLERYTACVGRSLHAFRDSLSLTIRRSKQKAG
jgi:hypothetical protein